MYVQKENSLKEEKRTGDMEKFNKFPEEMVVEILSRLPPKALMRFKCVHKSCYSLIKSPTFVDKNLSNSKNNKFPPTCVLVKRTVLRDNTIKDKNEIFGILRDGSNEKKESLLSLVNLCDEDYCDDHNHHSLVQDLNIPLPMTICPFTLHIAGHCDGIICLKGISDEDIVLCNPAINEFKFLPKSCLLLPPNDQDDYDAIESSTNAVGFGYDSKAKTYKVVRVVDFSGSIGPDLKRVEIYTLGDNSWREIQADVHCHSYWTPSFVIYFKGISYWWGFTPDDKEVILSFNMSDEQFHEIPVPNCLHVSDGCHRSLAVLRESVVLLTYEGIRQIPNSFDIWMMDDASGVTGSWTKYLTFVVTEGIQIPLAFLKSDELLMVTTVGRVVSYNYSTGQLKYLPVHGVEDPPYMQGIVYVNSIVSVM